MNNKMVLGILSVYAVILCGVLGFQIVQSKGIISAPANSEEVAVEDRLDSAVVIYENSPVILVNKSQMLIDKNDASMVPILENQAVYVPTAFFRTAYNAATSEDLSTCSATIRLDNQALVLDKKTADLVDSSKEKDIEYNNKVFIKNGCVYVPIDIFASAFDKFVYYYDNMIIISGMKNSFTDTESTDFINSLKSQVNDLPYVANEENMKEISQISTPGNILKQISGEHTNTNKAKTIPVQVLENKTGNAVNSSGNYVYYANDDVLYIIDSSNNTLKTISTVNLGEEFKCEKIYVQNDTLVVLGNKNNIIPTENIDGEVNFNHSTMACVYNIANKEKAIKLKELEIEGYYKNSVQYNGYIYLLAEMPIAELSKNGHYYPPSYRDSIVSPEVEELSYYQMQYFPEGGGKNYNVVASISIDDPTAKSELKSYLCAGDNVYMSDSNIYIAKNRYNAFDSNENIENTFIYRLSLSNGQIYTSGKGNVKGYVPNKFAMNENSGYFTLVSQYTKRGPNQNIANVYVLNNNLEVCGYANEILAGANVASTIFSKNMLFITPENSQSIYSVDLSEPTNPRGNGVLKLSTGNLLIYSYDENHIVTVDNGNNMLCLKLYDISDKDNPIALYSEELGKGNIETSMFNDTLSFYFDKEKNIFTLPVTIYDSDEKQNITFNGGYLYKINLDDGFERIGSVTLPDNSAVIRPLKKSGKLYNFMGNVAVAVDYDDLDNIKEIRFK
ncbi:MAG: beta-propeller domain-containing protein [Lachnospirales bacterium]